MTDDLEPYPFDIEREFRVEDVTHRLAETHVEYVREEAGHVVRADTLDEDAVIDAMKRLHDGGFNPRPDDADAPVTHLFAHPSPYYDLRNAIERHARAGTLSDVGVNRLEYRGIGVYGDPSLSESLALMIHERAIAPTPTFSSRRPWLVKHPRGIVAVELDE